MDRNPLTDPTSLIAYRLANGRSLDPAARDYPATGSRSVRLVGAGVLGVALTVLVAIVLLACI